MLDVVLIMFASSCKRGINGFILLSSTDLNAVLWRKPYLFPAIIWRVFELEYAKLFYALCKPFAKRSSAWGRRRRRKASWPTVRDDADTAAEVAKRSTADLHVRRNRQTNTQTAGQNDQKFSVHTSRVPYRLVSARFGPQSSTPPQKKNIPPFTGGLASSFTTFVTMVLWTQQVYLPNGIWIRRAV